VHIFQENISFTVQRAQDKNAAAKLLAFEHNGNLMETKKRNLDAFVKELAKKPSSLETSGRRVLDVLAYMSVLFLPKDRLLGSSGIIPVYYWFIRDMTAEEMLKVRDFLNQFEKERKENRKHFESGQHDRRLDDELLQYDKLSRSANDLRCHEGRFRILQKRFATFR